MKEEDLLCTVYSFSYFEAVAKDVFDFLKIGDTDLRTSEETVSYNSHLHENPTELWRWGKAVADGLERTRQVFKKSISNSPLWSSPLAFFSIISLKSFYLLLHPQEMHSFNPYCKRSFPNFKIVKTNFKSIYFAEFNFQYTFIPNLYSYLHLLVYLLLSSQLRGITKPFWCVWKIEIRNSL